MSVKRILITLCLGASGVWGSGQAWGVQYCVDSQFSVVNEEDLKQKQPQLHFVMTSPRYLRPTGKSFIQFEQRQLVRNYQAFPKRPVSLAPLDAVSYQDLQERCDTWGFVCTDEEILVPYDYLGLPATKKLLSKYSPAALKQMGPPIYDVLEILRQMSGKQHEYDQISSEDFQFLRYHFGPAMLAEPDVPKASEPRENQEDENAENAENAENTQSPGPPTPDQVWLAWEKLKGSQEPVPQHVYFHTHFPEPRFVVLKLGRIPPTQTGAAEGLSLIDLQFVIQSQVSYRILPEAVTTSSRWCLPQEESLVQGVMAHIKKPDLPLALSPPQSAFSILQYGYTMPDESSWNQVWLLNLLAQVQRSAFLHLPEAEVIRGGTTEGEPRTYAIGENYLGGLWSEIAAITEETRPTHWFTALQAWVNQAYEWIKTGAGQAVIRKSIDAPDVPDATAVTAATAEGQVMRTHTQWGSVLDPEKHELSPAFTLSRSVVEQWFPHMSVPGQGARYVMGAQDVIAWVQLGIYQIAVNGKVSKGSSIPRLSSLEVSSPDEKIGKQLAGWLRPKTLQAFELESQLSLSWKLRHGGWVLAEAQESQPAQVWRRLEQRWSDQDGWWLLDPPDWQVLAQGLEGVSHWVSPTQSQKAPMRHLDRAFDLFCVTGEPQTRLCQYKAQEAGQEEAVVQEIQRRAMYFGLAGLDDVQLLRLDFQEGQEGQEGKEEVGVFFETLGVVARSESSLGSPVTWPYEGGWLAQRGIPTDLFLEKLLSVGTAPLSLDTILTVMDQPPPSYEKTHVKENFSFYNHPNHWVHTFSLEGMGEPSLGLMVQRRVRQGQAPSKPVEIHLPRSCVGSGQSTVFPWTVQVTDFVKFASTPIEKIPVPSMLVSVGCRSGEILFFVDGAPLACDEDNPARQWHLHQALFAQPDFSGFGEPSEEHVQSHLKEWFCKTPEEWAASHPVPPEEGVPPIQAIRAVPDAQGNGLRIFLAMKSEGIFPGGEIYTVKLDAVKLDTHPSDSRPPWSMRISVATSSHLLGRVHFRNNVNLISTQQVSALRYRQPVDLAVSRPLTQEIVTQLITTLAQAADAQGQVDACSVVVPPPPKDEESFGSTPDPEAKPEPRVPSVLEKLLFQEMSVDASGQVQYGSVRPIYLLFLLNSSGSVLSRGHHALTKLVWMPEISLEGIKTPADASAVQACVGLIKKVLGHSLSIELNLTLAQSLEAIYKDNHPVPHLVVNGSGDGGMAIFSPEYLLGTSFTPSQAEDFLFVRWAKSLLRFIPTHYFYFGQTPAEPPRLYDHQLQGACVAFEKNPRGILAQSQSQMNSCRPFLTPEELARHEAQLSAQERAWNFAHRFYHLYQAPGDEQVMLREGPQALSPFLSHHPEEEEGEQLQPTTLPTQREVAKAFSAFYDPNEGQAQLVQFDSRTPLDELKIPPLSVRQKNVSQQISEVFSSSQVTPFLKTQTTEYLLKALRRYFCSFFTVYQGVDHLKVDPIESQGGDEPTYKAEVFPYEWIGPSALYPGARYLVFRDVTSGGYAFLRHLTDRSELEAFPAAEDPRVVVIPFDDYTLKSFEEALGTLPPEDPFFWQGELSIFPQGVAWETKLYVRFQGQTRQLNFARRAQPSDLAVDIEGDHLKFFERRTYLYRGDAKVIVDAAENDDPMQLPSLCQDLTTEEGVVFSQSVVQWKVSALDEWRKGFPELAELKNMTDQEKAVQAQVIAYKNQVQTILNQWRSEGPEGQVAVSVMRRLRSSLLAPDLIDALAHVELPDGFLKQDLADLWGMGPTSLTGKLESVVDQLIEGYGDHYGRRDSPFVERIRALMQDQTFVQQIQSLVDPWVGRGEDETQIYLRKRMTTLFLYQFLVQVVMYSEYFAPAVGLSYEALFQDALPVAQQQLLRGVKFPRMSPALRQKVQARLSPWMSFQARGEPSESVPVDRAERVWNRLKLCSTTQQGEDVRCGERDAGGREINGAMAPEGKAFLNYFLRESFRVPLTEKARAEGLPPETLDPIFETYRKLFVAEQLYFIGVQVGDAVLPLTFFVPHYRPNVALADAEGQWFMDDAWGEKKVGSGMLHPYFDLNYLRMKPTPPEGYREDLTQLNAWGLRLNTHRLEDRLYESSAGEFTPKSFQRPATWTLRDIAAWVLVAPFKMTEFTALTAKTNQTDFYRAAERLINNEFQKSDWAALNTQSDFHMGVDLGYPTKGGVLHHFDMFNPRGLAPVGNHWVSLSRGFRSLPDIYFQALWDKWVHLPSQRHPENTLLRQGVFEPRHQTLHQFIHPEKSRPFYSPDHTAQIWALFSSLFQGERAPPYLSELKPYHDMLAVEVMFPMIWRYLMFPKYIQEFDSPSGMDCRAGVRDSQIDFEVPRCLEQRSKHHLKTYTDDLNYFFVWDSFAPGSEQPGRLGFHPLFESGFSEASEIGPFWVMLPQAPKINLEGSRLLSGEGVLGLNPHFWMDSAYAKTLREQYEQFLQSHYLRTVRPEAETTSRLNPLQNHVWAQRSVSILQTAWEWLKDFWQYWMDAEGQGLPQSASLKLMTVRKEDIPLFFETGSGVRRMAEVLGLDLRVGGAQDRVQRYPRHGLLMHETQGLDRAQSAEWQMPLADEKLALFERNFSDSDIRIPVPDVKLISHEESSSVRFQGCVGVTCFDYGFRLKPSRWEFLSETADTATHRDPATQHQILIAVAKQVDATLPGRHLLHVADWVSTPEHHVVGVNVTQMPTGEPEVMIFRLEKLGDQWQVAQPSARNVQRLAATRLAGDMQLEGEGLDQQVCASYLQWKLELAPGQQKHKLIQVFVKQCTRFVDTTPVKDLENWLTGR